MSSRPLNISLGSHLSQNSGHGRANVLRVARIPSLVGFVTRKRAQPQEFINDWSESFDPALK
jgi:hypothetical protein